jgi:hypothetical protein
MKKGYAFAGVNAHLAQKISSVKEVVHRLKEEFALAEKRTLSAIELSHE